MSRSGSMSKMVEEVGFPGISEEEVGTTSPTTNETAQAEKQDEEVFERTSLQYKTSVRVFNCNDANDASELAALTDKFMNSKMPKKEGDPPIYLRLKQETTFTKDGYYLAAVTWAECTKVIIKVPLDDKDAKL